MALAVGLALFAVCTEFESMECRYKGDWGAESPQGAGQSIVSQPIWPSFLYHSFRIVFHRISTILGREGRCEEMQIEGDKYRDMGLAKALIIILASSSSLLLSELLPILLIGGLSVSERRET